MEEREKSETLVKTECKCSMRKDHKVSRLTLKYILSILYFSLYEGNFYLIDEQREREIWRVFENIRLKSSQLDSNQKSQGMPEE